MRHTGAAASSSVEELEPSVMGAIDGDGDDRRYVIADVSRDDAWIASDVGDSHVLDDWA